MVKAIRVHAPGGPDSMRLEDIEVGAPGPGQVRLRQTVIGVNFIDVYHRNGTYPLTPPYGVGMEAAGVVEAVGEGVTHVAAGDRVAYAAGPPGSYAEARVHRADMMMKLPAEISDEQAACLMLQGMTARYLLKETYPVKRGDFVLIHAAAGGMGLLLCQWARHLGATVIGTTSNEEKAALAQANGCEHPILYTRESVAERVKAITGGKGVAVVYDGVGKDTFQASLDSLALRGMMVSYGAASGTPDPVPLSALAGKALFLTRPSLFNYVTTRDELLANAGDVFAVVRSGAVKVQLPKVYPLADAAQAHRDLEGRKTTGPLVLKP
jgi:NADPH2:quinone reductase